MTGSNRKEPSELWVAAAAVADAGSACARRHRLGCRDDGAQPVSNGTCCRPPNGSAWPILALPENRNFLRRSATRLLFSAIYVPATVVLSLVVAVLLNQRIFGQDRLFRMIYFLPVISSPTAVCTTYLSWLELVLIGSDQSLVPAGL